ncbi:MAG: hypothetical protein JST85_26165 [Acidobacteria bacterium]|nr:hypothetical protein [Acidobacteriota bacterium]
MLEARRSTSKKLGGTLAESAGILDFNRLAMVSRTGAESIADALESCQSVQYQVFIEVQPLSHLVRRRLIL